MDLDFSPTIAVTTSLGFLVGRLPLSVGFCFKNGLIGVVPSVGGTSPPYHFFACSMAFLRIRALLLPSSIFASKGDEKKELDKIQYIYIRLKNKPEESNRLTLVCSLIVVMGDVCGLKSFTILVNGIKGDKLFLGSLLEWDTKDSLRKIPLFKRHFDGLKLQPK